MGLPSEEAKRLMRMPGVEHLVRCALITDQSLRILQAQAAHSLTPDATDAELETLLSLLHHSGEDLKYMILDLRQQAAMAAAGAR